MWLLDDFKAYNPSTKKFDPLPANGSVIKGNRCQEAQADPWQPFWELSTPPSPRNAALEDAKVAESFVNAAVGPSNLAVNFDQSDYVNTVASALSSPRQFDSNSNDDCSADAGSCTTTREASETVRPADIFPQTSSAAASAMSLAASLSTQPGATSPHFGSPEPFEEYEPFGDFGSFEDFGPYEGSSSPQDSEFSEGSDPTGEPTEEPIGEWEAFKIVGEEVVDGETHYMVAWKPTLEPERNLTHLQNLLQEWKDAKARRVVQKPRKIRINLRKAPAAQPAKRGRGRPRMSV